jgi:prolyl-tRNA synthetase
MRASKAFLPTRKEPQKDARTPGYERLVRAGYVRRLASGAEVLLPLGARALANVERLAVEAASRIDAEEIVALDAATGAGGFVAAVLDVARGDLRGYKELPRVFLRRASAPAPPRSGSGLGTSGASRIVEVCVVAATEDDVRAKGDALLARFAGSLSATRLGPIVAAASAPPLPYARVVALSSDVAGDVALFTCGACGASLTEDAAPTDAAVAEANDAAPARDVPTPGMSQVEDVAAFLEVSPRDVLKSMLVRAGGELVLAVVRGDHAVSEARLARALGVAPSTVTLATPDEVVRATGAKVGFAGPVGFRGRIVVDPSAAVDAPRVVGANAADMHTVDVRFGRDFSGEIMGIRALEAGAPCPSCGAPLTPSRASLAATFTALGQAPAAAREALFATASGERVPFYTGLVTIEVSRTLGHLAEAHHDDAGLVLPHGIAPFDVHLVALGAQPELVSAASALVNDLEAAGLSVLFDDRDERPGPKLASAELVGMPVRVALGARSLAVGAAECARRVGLEAATRVPLADVVAWARAALG